MLKLKAGSMSQVERCANLDEMAVTPSVELHMGTGKLFGNVTLPGHNGRATHACVFMLAGVIIVVIIVIIINIIMGNTQATE